MLERLSIYSNDFESLPEEIYSLTSLKELDLGYNKLSSIPKSISNLASLKKLNLRSNDFESLPEEIDSLKSLEELNLGFNQCPMCGAVGKVKVLSHIDVPMHTKKQVCKKCGYEF